MQNRNLITILPAAVMLTLAGCGESSVITDLKEQPLSTVFAPPSLTYGNALDNRKACTSTSWEVKKDSQGREVVQYECEVSFEELNEQIIENIGDEALITSAIHSMEWRHSNGEYSYSQGGFYVNTSDGDSVSQELDRHNSYYLAIDPEVTEVNSFVNIMEQYLKSEW